MKALEDLLAQTEFTDEEVARILRIRTPEEADLLQRRAYDLTTWEMGPNVYLRGLIEISNVCTANCRYCGIRKANHDVERYTLPRETILECARLALESGYGSIAIQAGERQDPKWVTFIGELLHDIHEMSCTEALPQGLGITLSLGEQSLEVYEYWAEASGNPDGLR